MLLHLFTPRLSLPLIGSLTITTVYLNVFGNRLLDSRSEPHVSSTQLLALLVPTSALFASLSGFPVCPVAPAQGTISLGFSQNFLIPKSNI